MRTYIMRYYEFGKQERIVIEARTVSEAERKAKTKMYVEYITTAWLVCPSGNQVLLSR